MESHYCETDPTMISYQNFLADIDIVFNLPCEHKDPQQRPPIFDYTIAHSSKQTEEQDCEQLLKRLGEVARKHKLLLKPYFQDKDIAKIGRVSFTRMRSILDNHKIPLSDYQYELLCRNFSYEGK